MTHHFARRLLQHDGEVEGGLWRPTTAAGARRWTVVHAQIHEHSGVLFAFLARGWASAAGLVLVLLVTTHLSDVEQGYFFLFQALLQFQFLVELGFAMVLTQFVSHESAHLVLRGEGVEGATGARARLVGLVRLARRWYLAAAMAFFVLGAPAGVILLSSGGGGEVAWRAPWLALCGAQAVALLCCPLPALLEGTGDVARSQRDLLIANVVAAIGAWLALLGGAGLWAAPVQVGLRASVALALLLPATQHLRHLTTEGAAQADDWQPAFFRQQARIAASWFAGMLMFQSFTPIAFAVHGAVMAGQVGVLVQAFSAVNQLGTVWLTAAQPRMGHLGSLGRFGDLRSLMRRTLLRCIGTSALLAGLVFGGLAALDWLRPEHTHRFGSLPMAAAFLGAAVILQASNVYTAAIRFQRQEPFVAVSWVSALAVVVSNFALGYAGGGTGIAIGFALVVGAILVPWVVLVARTRVDLLIRQERMASGPSGQGLPRPAGPRAQCEPQASTVSERGLHGLVPERRSIR